MSKGSKRRPIAQHAKAAYDANHPFPIPTARRCPHCGHNGQRFERGRWTCTRCKQPLDGKPQ